MLPVPLVLLLSVQLLAASTTGTDEGVLQLPSSQLLARADTYLATGRGSDALELYDVVAQRDKSSYVSGVNTTRLCRRGGYLPLHV